jgi:FkbM family methyltransferase
MINIDQYKYREGTSDERVLQEVLSGAYRKLSIGFDIRAGEQWLDLGANIGAFAIYCGQRKASVECYEPDPACFSLLRKNAPRGTVCINSAVSADCAAKLPFYTSNNKTEFSRYTLKQVNKFVPAGVYANKYAGFLTARSFDGVKMDIEGSEGGLLDNWLVPKCRKLVLEYHSSRDTSVANFKRRVQQLRKHFSVVDYPAELDRIVASGAVEFKKWLDVPDMPHGGRFVQWPMADRLIFCIK